METCDSVQRVVESARESTIRRRASRLQSYFLWSSPRRHCNAAVLAFMSTVKLYLVRAKLVRCSSTEN